jgi:hypothetical protein
MENTKNTTMKEKAILVCLAILLSMASCGPTDYQKHQAELQKERDKSFAANGEISDKMDSIQKFRQQVLQSLSFISDTTIHFENGMISVPDGEIWEIKQRMLTSPDSAMPAVICECPQYQKSSDQSTTGYDAIISGRCIKFSGSYEVNNGEGGHYNARLLNVKTPKYIPPYGTITALKSMALLVGRYKVGDQKSFQEIRRLVKATQGHPNNQSFKDYYYVHCFNNDFETTPLKFATCSEQVD